MYGLIGKSVLCPIYLALFGALQLKGTLHSRNIIQSLDGSQKVGLYVLEWHFVIFYVFYSITV